MLEGLYGCWKVCRDVGRSVRMLEVLYGCWMVCTDVCGRWSLSGRKTALPRDSLLDRRTDRQRQTGSLLDRRTDRQAQTDRQSARQTYRQTDRDRETVC